MCPKQDRRNGGGLPLPSSASCIWKGEGNCIYIGSRIPIGTGGLVCFPFSRKGVCVRVYGLRGGGSLSSSKRENKPEDVDSSGGGGGSSSMLLIEGHLYSAKVHSLCGCERTKRDVGLANDCPCR